MGWVDLSKEQEEFPMLSTNLRPTDELEKRNKGKIPDPEPRKGMYRFVNSVLNKKQDRIFTLNTATLGRLANTDPITFAIRRTIKSFISQVKWDIVPDIEDFEAELDRYEEIALANISPYLTTEKFESEILDSDLTDEIEHNLKRIMDGPEEDNKGAIRWYFQTVLRKVKQKAETHRYLIKRIFECPNETDKTFRNFQEKVLDDLLIYDSGVIIKNWSATNKLAELYTIPGQEVKIYRNEDGTAPEPPEPAYIWEQQGINRAEFSSEELIYLMQNPQQSGYGLSPLEVAAYVITASLYADEYQIDYFKHSNVPPGVFDLGENVDLDQLSTFRQMWENEVQGRGGQHRMMFLSGTKDPKFIPMATRSNRDMQLLEYLRWTMAVKCAAFGISVQDLGITDDLKGLGGGGVAEQQEQLSKSKGVKSLLSMLQEHYNLEIVKQEYPYDDVKFEWHDIDISNKQEESTIDLADIQAGVLSRNDRRQKLGMKPIDGGDEYVIQTGSGLIPVRDLEPKPADSGQEEEQVAPQEIKPQTEEEKPAEEGLVDQEVTSPKEQPVEEPAVEVPLLEEGKLLRNANEPVERKPLRFIINRRMPVRKQGKMMKDIVEKFKKEGLEATLLIGFKAEE